MKLSPDWKKQLKRLWWLLLLPLAFLFAEIAHRNPAWIERYYTQGLYPVIRTVIGFFTSVFPFSVAEFLIYIMAAFVVIFTVYCIVMALKKRLTMLRFVSFLISIGITISVGFQIFYFSWGFNYYRLPLAYSLGLEVKSRDPQELVDLCVSLAAMANSLREDVSEDKNGTFALSKSLTETFADIPSAYQKLGEFYPQFSGYSSVPKQVLASEALSWAGIAGIYIPFTEEPNVNVHANVLLVPSAAAHESAHMMGVAREDEANFVGFLACMASGNPDLMYSGVMLALIHSGNMLSDLSPAAYSQLTALYSDGVKRDLAAHNAYWDAYNGGAEEFVNNMNDAYLKGNKQSDGVLSYGRMVDLLLAYFDAQQPQTSSTGDAA